MKYILILLVSLSIFSSCTKQPKIDLPEPTQEQPVIKDSFDLLLYNTRYENTGEGVEIYVDEKQIGVAPCYDKNYPVVCGSNYYLTLRIKRNQITNLTVKYKGEKKIVHHLLVSDDRSECGITNILF